MTMDIFIALCAFIFVTIFLLVINLRKLRLIKKGKNKRNKKVFITEIRYLEVKYGIAPTSLLNKKFIILMAVINALIIAGTFMIIVLIPWGMLWQLLVGFVLVMGLIYSVYGIIGNILIKKGLSNEHTRNRK